MFDYSFDALWEAYYGPHLTKYQLNQFKKALRQPSSRLLTDIIQPMTYQRDAGSYLCVTDNPTILGRGPDTSRTLPADVTDVAWAIQSYFTNPLRLVPNSDPEFNSPKLRTALGPYYVVTLEFDGGGMDFVRQQLDWFRSSTNKLDSPIGQFARHLWRQFADFRGLTVVYSGSKSFHYHLTFSTDLLAHRASDLTSLSLRNGFGSTYDTLKGIMCGFETLAIPEGLVPDDSLRVPEHLRRLPGGVRASKDNHLFGVPAGEIVPQVVMWEHFFDRSTGDRSAFDPAKFNASNIRKPSSRPGNKVSPTFMNGGEGQRYAVEKMQAMFPGGDVWPMFAGFTRERGENGALFFNAPGDGRPTSYMGETYATVQIQGSNPLWLNNTKGDPNCMPRLRKPLGEMLALWEQEYEASQAPDTLPHHRQRTPLEQRFADQATTHDAAITAMAKTLDDLILTGLETNGATFLTAPEGISKTRSLIAQTSRYAYALELNAAPTLVMYAFATYAMATEKAAEFNAHYGAEKHWNRRYKAVVVPSFSHLYKKACDKLDIQRYTDTDAAANGYASLMAMIRVLQPEVIERFRNHYAKLWAKIGNASPVIFCVHQVAHDWIKNTTTRAMFAPSYWNDDLDPHSKQAEGRQATKLGLLIHDEISPENLLFARPKPLVDWIEAMKLDHPSAWGSTGGLADKLDAFTSFKKAFPPPVPTTFEEARQLADITAWETVTTVYHAEYGDARDDWTDRDGNHRSDIYAATAGKEWSIHVRDWPTHAAHRTVVLTTEAVPTAIVRKIGEPWSVTELDTPHIPKDHVETYPSKSVTSLKLATLVKAEQERFHEATGRKLLAISNKAGGLVDTATHASAKGSNSYMGQPVVQTMAMMAAEQYEQYEALNAWTGRDDLVLLRHIDEYNQSAGRNLGFRKRDGASHRLLINDRLFNALDEVKPFARYVMDEVVTVHHAKQARKKAQTRKAKVTTATKAPTLAEVRAMIRKTNPRYDDTTGATQ